MTIWQKLLMPAGADLMLKRGIAEVGGPVVRAGDVAGLVLPTWCGRSGWVGKVSSSRKLR